MKAPAAHQFFSLGIALLMAIGVAGCIEPTTLDPGQAARSATAAETSLEPQDATFNVSSDTSEASASTSGAESDRGGGFIGSGH